MKSLLSACVPNSEKGEEGGDRRAERGGDRKKMRKKKIVYVSLCLFWVSIYTGKKPNNKSTTVAGINMSLFQNP